MCVCPHIYPPPVRREIVNNLAFTHSPLRGSPTGRVNANTFVKTAENGLCDSVGQPIVGR